MLPPRSPALRLGAQVSRLAVWGGGLMILLAAGLITAEVLMRKIVGVSTGGADELSGYALAIGSSWALGFALVRRAHVRVDALYAQLPAGPRALLDCLSILAITAFALVLAWFGGGVLRESLALSARSPTTLSVPLWIPQGLWVIGFAIFALVSLNLSVHAGLALLRGDRAGLSRLVGSRTADEEVAEGLGMAAQKPPQTGGRPGDGPC